MLCYNITFLLIVAQSRHSSSDRCIPTAAHIFWRNQQQK